MVSTEKGIRASHTTPLSADVGFEKRSIQIMHRMEAVEGRGNQQAIFFFKSTKLDQTKSFSSWLSGANDCGTCKPWKDCSFGICQKEPRNPSETSTWRIISLLLRLLQHGDQHWRSRVLFCPFIQLGMAVSVWRTRNS